MSMLDDEDPSMVECSICDLIAFEPKPCGVCVRGSGKLCSDCRKECAGCGEAVCYDHWDEKRETCTECERTRMIESGEALADWKRYGNC